MPNYYAHLEFGRHVLDTLSLPLRRGVEAEKDAFLLGLYGPDPLFFALGRRTRTLGHEVHCHAVRPVAERLFQVVGGHIPMAAGYTAGFLCHFALDSTCHPLVEALSGEGTLTHSQVEAELDRRLMLRVGLNPMEDTPIPPIPVSPALEPVLCAAYPGIVLRQFQQGYDLFCRAARLLTLASGTRLRGMADRLACRPGLSALRGVVLAPEPDAACQAASAELAQLLLNAVSPTAQILEEFFAAQTLGDWYDRDFYGHGVQSGQESLVAAPAPSV